MKKSKAKPARLNTVTGTEITVPGPITGSRACDSSCPCVSLYRYNPGSLVCATRLRPINPRYIINGGDCGELKDVLLKSAPDFFARIYPPTIFNGNEFLKMVYRHIANMCKALDDLGVFWMISCEDNLHARKLFGGNNVTIWQNSGGGRTLFITNYTELETPVELNQTPVKPKYINFES